MAVASGILKSTAWKKQSALGSASSGGGGKEARRVTAVFQAPRDMYESNEIQTHHQSTGSAYGMSRAEGTINGELSAATYSELVGSILEKDMAAGVNSGALTITYGGTSGAWTAARASDSFLTDGFKVGDVIRASGGSVTANNTRNFLVTAVVALTITFIALDGATVTAGSSTTTTLTVSGKKTHAPTSSHTKDYYTFEEFYSDLTRSETYADCRISSIAVSLPATGNATMGISVVGLSRTLGNSQVLTAPARTSTPIMSAINGVILINGTAQTVATGINFTIENGAANAGAVIGSNFGNDVISGRIRVTGTFTAQFDSVTLQTLFNNETNTSITVALTGDNTGDAECIAFTMPRVKISSDTPDDGEQAIVRSYSFIAEYNAAGGSGIATEQTILSFQDTES
jgi:hypothetical protein